MADQEEVNRHRAHLDTHPTCAAFKHPSPPTHLPLTFNSPSQLSLTFHSPTTHPRPTPSLLDHDFYSCARPGCRPWWPKRFPTLGSESGFAVVVLSTSLPTGSHVPSRSLRLQNGPSSRYRMLGGLSQIFVSFALYLTLFVPKHWSWTLLRFTDLYTPFTRPHRNGSYTKTTYGERA